jgi:hypothetical protein
VTEIEIRLTLHSIALESLMAAPSHRRCRSGPEYEDRLQEAIAGVRSKRFKQEEAATIFNVSCCPNLFHLLMFFKVSRQTIGDRMRGKHKARHLVNQGKQLLSPAQESVVVDWIDHRAQTAKPLDPTELRSFAYDMAGVVPGKNWHLRFEARHPALTLSKPSALDPKRAQNFNLANITGYFELIQQVKTSYPTLPPEHIWNMDEKGIQLGGGRKNSPKKYYRLRSLKKSKFYRLRSDNLELVTIIECISASGVSMPPSFVLAAGPVPALEDLEVPIGG